MDRNQTLLEKTANEAATRPSEERAARRLALIRKKHLSAQGLAEAEATELAELQAEFERWANSQRRLPTEVMAELERLEGEAGPGD